MSKNFIFLISCLYLFIFLIIGCGAKKSTVDGITGIAASKWAIFDLALTRDGTVWARRFGPMKDLTDVMGIANGGAHSLVLKKDGTVWAWGMNGDGCLDNGSFATI